MGIKANVYRKTFRGVSVLMALFLTRFSLVISSDDDLSQMVKLGRLTEEIYGGVLREVAAKPSNGSHDCFPRLEEALMEGGLGARTILDATGKPASGLLEGNFAWLGDYRQCADEPNLHYCLTTAAFNTESLSERVLGRFQWGLCLPRECGSKDASLILQYINLTLGNGFFRGIQSQCDVSSFSTVGWPFACTLAFFAILFLVSVSATLYDRHARTNIGDTAPERVVRTTGYHTITLSESTKETDRILKSSEGVSKEELLNSTKFEKDLSVWKRVLLCFSYNRTFSQIFRTKIADGDILCLNGMRVISMFWIILGHTVSFQQKSGAMGNTLWVFTEFARWFTSQAIFNAYPALDTFFFMGGLLVTYTGFKYMTRTNGKVNWACALFHRYLRLTPALGSLMLLYTNVFPYLGSGPFWYQRLKDCEGCYQWWWTNLLYINNFVPANTSSGCVSWTWYLATDMQLFICSIFIIVILWRSRVIGGIAVAVTLAASIIVKVVIFIERDYQATHILNTVLNGGERYFPFSVKPYTCASAYLIGVVMGYCLHVIRYRGPMKLHPIAVVIGWAVAWTTGMAVVYGPYSAFNSPGNLVVPLSQAANVIYGSIASLSWALALGWVVFACEMGYGGVINTFLSWKFWIPLSRLTYCAYLLHPPIIYLYTGTETTLFHPSIINQSFLFAGFVVISYAAAMILSALVEMPVCNLQKMLGKQQR